MSWTHGERKFLTAAEALELLPHGSHIHTFSPLAEGGPVEAIVPRQVVVDLINADVIRELAGPVAGSMGRGLVVWQETEPLFIQTKPGQETTRMPLTYEEILQLQPGEKITFTWKALDGSPVRREGTVTQTPVHNGYYYVGQLGTWALYARPEELAVGKMAPSAKVVFRYRGKRRQYSIQSSDDLFISRGWQTNG